MRLFYQILAKNQGEKGEGVYFFRASGYTCIANMQEIRLISLHPRLAALFDGLFSLVSIWWLSTVGNSWIVALWFAVRLLWWGLLVNFVYYPPYINRYKHLLALAIFNIGAVAFLVFSDGSNIQISRMLVFVMSFMSFWLIPSRADSLSIMEKPHRRWKFFLALFGVSGIWLFLSALSIFQIISGRQVVEGVLVASLLVVSISVWEWVEYGEKISTKMLILTAVLFLVLVEASGVVFLWPVGYFVSSFFMTWFWYLSWLLFRFNLSSNGIDWSKQKYFLTANFLLMSIFLSFIVRWK